jgi:hypothetical protein
MRQLAILERLRRAWPWGRTISFADGRSASAGLPNEHNLGLRLVVEPNMSGHRFNYVRILVEYAREREIPIALLTTESGHVGYLAKVSGEARDVRTFVTASETPSVAEVARISRKIGPSHVIVPSGDWAALGLLLTAGWHGSGHLRILVIREFGQGRPGSLIACGKTSLRKLIFTIVGLQRRVTIALLTSPISPTTGLLARVPDPIEFEPSPRVIDELREKHDISSAVYWFAVAGGIDERKSIPLVMDALSLATKRVARPIGLILAGFQSPQVKSHAEECGPKMGLRIVQADRQLTSTELDSFIAIADCVILAHTNDSPSGILGKAAKRGGTILAAGAPTLRRDVARLGVGAYWCPLEASAIAEKMVLAVHNHEEPSSYLAGVQEFGAFLLDWRDR